MAALTRRPLAAWAWRGAVLRAQVLSAVGVVTMATQALLVELVRRRLGEGPATHAGLALLAASYLALACSRGTLAGLLLSLLPSAVGGSVLTTINTALLTQVRSRGAVAHAGRGCRQKPRCGPVC